MNNIVIFYILNNITVLYNTTLLTNPVGILLIFGTILFYLATAMILMSVGNSYTDPPRVNSFMSISCYHYFIHTDGNNDNNNDSKHFIHEKYRTYIYFFVYIIYMLG